MQEERKEFLETGAELYAKAYFLGAHRPRVLVMAPSPSRAFPEIEDHYTTFISWRAGYLE